MITSRFRFIMIMDKDNEVMSEFSVDQNDTHRNLWDRIKDNEEFKRDYSIPIYGRFYTVLYGNSRNPQLIVYGSSSDYDIEKLGHYQIYYEKQLRKLAFEKGWDLLFLP